MTKSSASRILMTTCLKAKKMSEPTDKSKLSTFVSEFDQRAFKAQAAYTGTPMYRRLEDWIRFDNRYFAEYREAIDIEELMRMYFG